MDTAKKKHTSDYEGCSSELASKRPKTDADDMSAKTEKAATLKTSEDDTNDKPSGDDNEDDDLPDMSRLVEFRKDGPTKFRLHRAAGGDVMQVMNEHNPEGCLEVADDFQSAVFYAKFPSDKGLVAGRLDNIPPKELDGPPTYFTAILSKAFIDYGDWSGAIHRDSDTPGVSFRGSCMSMGHQVAIAGHRDVSCEEPFYVDRIHCFFTNKDEEEPPQDDESVPAGFKPLPKDSLCVTLFFQDGSESYCSGSAAPVPVSFWFSPLAGDEVSGSEKQGADTKMPSACAIPNEIMADIKKLPAAHAEKSS